MFSGLLNNLQNAMKEAKSVMRQTNQTLTQTKNQLGIQPKQELDYNILLKYSKVATFPKSQRFKQLKKQQITHTATIGLDQSYLTESTTTSQKGIKFQKEERFKEQKLEQKQILYPKYDLVKKNPQKPIITPMSNKQKNILGKSTYTNSTMDDSICASLGPGTYTPNVIIPQKTVMFPKEKRFPQKKPQNNDIPLYPKDTMTKKRPPTISIKPTIIKNEKQISKQKQQQARQRLKMIYWNTISLEIDRIFKNKNGPILKENYFQIQKLTGRQKRCAMQMLLDRMNQLRGGFQYNIRTNIQKQNPCQVVFRKSTPKPFKFPQHTPAPDQYYPKDDYIKPSIVGYQFEKHQQKAPMPDTRDYDINDDYLKKIQSAIINPQHKHKILNQEQIATLNRGPGFYDALFKQVEKRNDIGVIKMPEINQYNDRANQLQLKKQINDGVYYPKYTAIDKNVPTALYKPPSNVEPPNLPQKVLFPEHWVFYDGDLNKVRAQVAKNVLFSGNLNYTQYQQFVKKINEFKQYLKRQIKMPEIGEYNVKYTEIDPKIPVPNFDKMLQKNIQPIQKPQGQVDGDNLILNPTKLQPHMPNIEFKKMIGREDNQSDQNEIQQGDVLLLEPKLLQKKLPEIKFEKMIGRDQNQQDNEEGIEGDILILHPEYPEKHIPTINIQKNEKKIEEVDIEKEQIKLNIQYTQVNKRVKGFVNMQRHSQVRLVPVLRKKQENQ